jgi:hypothetical protein
MSRSLDKARISSAIAFRILISWPLWAGIVTAEQRTGESGPAGTLETGFAKPPDSARPYVWWHWMNGNVTREGITADLEAMAKAGIAGASIFNLAGPPHNCETPAGPVDYMSPLWLDLVHHAASEAKRLGLELGFQNCAGWSTTGGPWIKPEDNMQQLVSTATQVKGGGRIRQQLPRPESRLNYYHEIAVLAFPTPKDNKERVYRWESKTLQSTARVGLQPDLARPFPAEAVIATEAVVDLTRQLDADGVLTWEAPPGDWTLLRLGNTPVGNYNAPSPKSGQGLEVNKLNRRGVDVHWKHGIQPVLERLGPLAGTTLNTVLVDSYEAGNHMWSEDIPAEFKKRRGYDLTPYLPALMGWCVGSGPVTERFYWDYRRTVSEMVVENYYGYIAELCRQRGLRSAIEPYRGPFESMAVAMRADIPTAEFFNDLSFGVPFLKLASSAAHLNQLPVAASEAFTSGADGWKGSHPATLKFAGDFAWAEGINRLVIHRYAHQPWSDRVPGMCMGPYGIHFDRNATWWEPGRAWLEYITRSQFLLQSGDFIGDVLGFVGEAAPHTTVDYPGMKSAGYDHDACGTDVIPTLAVRDGRIVTPSGREYRLLVLPRDVTFMTLGLARKIRDLVREGAAVLAPKPEHVPSLSGFPASEKEMLSIAAEVWGACDGKKVTSNVYGKGRIFAGIPVAQAMAQLKIAPDVKILPEAGTLNWIHRRTAEADLYFLSNQSKVPVQTTVGFRVNSLQPEFWNPETATVREASGWTVAGEHVLVPLALELDGSIFVNFRHAAKPKADPVVRVEEPPCAESNQLVIHRAVFEAVGGDPRFKPCDVADKVKAQMCNGCLAETAEKLVGVDPSPFIYKQLQLDYSWAGRTNTLIYRLREKVVLPPPHLMASAWCAGLESGKEQSLKAWNNGSYTAKRASGKTESITVSGIPDPVTLSGPWEVGFQSGRGAPAKACFEKLISWPEHAEPGIRYFSGTASYTKSFKLPATYFKNGREVWLDLGDVGVMAEVSLNGQKLATLWHPPYRMEVSKAVQQGANTLEVKVTNLWGNRLIGDAQQPDDCAWEGSHLKAWPEWLVKNQPRPAAGRVCFTTFKHWNAGDRLQPSGLMGPVTLRCAALIVLP